LTFSFDWSCDEDEHFVNCLHKNGWTATSTYGVKGGDGGRENETKMDLALLK